jgi:hypothetical protein
MAAAIIAVGMIAPIQRKLFEHHAQRLDGFNAALKIIARNAPPNRDHRHRKATNALASNIESNVRDGVAFLHGKKTVGHIPPRTPRDWLIWNIKDRNHTLRSWHAWGEPSPWGKLVCERLKIENLIFGLVLKAISCRHSSPEKGQ